MPLDHSRKSVVEDDANRVVAGVDEVGRGPLAGPVMAAAVVIDVARLPERELTRLADSKTLRPEVREDLAAMIREYATIGMGEATVEEIDTLNILNASHLAMARAVQALDIAPDHALVDGNRAPALACSTECVVGGDAKVPAIAAASIVAKVARDARLDELARDHPGYGWERNRGYATPEHRAALLRLGPCAHHRRSFAPVRALLNS